MSGADGLGGLSHLRACRRAARAGALFCIALWGCATPAQTPILREISRGPMASEPSVPDTAASIVPAVVSADDSPAPNEPDHPAHNEAGLLVLAAAAEMIENKVIVRGSCWDYANAVYERAGFDSKQLIKVFQAPKEGPYAELSLIQPGDWLYIVNKPKTLGTHSLIFVAWEDLEKGQAQVINYVGGRKRKPGDYRSSDVSRVFEIRRAASKEASVP